MRKEINYMKMAVINTEGEEQEVCMSILRMLENKRRARKRYNRIRIAVLKTITWIAGSLLFIGVLSLDSESLPIPVAVIIASGLWIALIAFANN